jgi:hypothetical protein
MKRRNYGNYWQNGYRGTTPANTMPGPKKERCAYCKYETAIIVFGEKEPNPYKECTCNKVEEK